MRTAYDDYLSAIEADPTEPAYDLALGDYLRVQRGAANPAFPQAEFHYHRALSKLRSRSLPGSWDAETERRLVRALIALYERDGYPISVWPRPGRNVFCSTQIIYGRDTTDLLFENDATRDFASEAQLTSQRLGRALSRRELGTFVRSKEQLEYNHRIRIRNGFWPVVDVIYRDDELHDSNRDNFFTPRRFVTSNLEEYGFATKKPLLLQHPFTDLRTCVEYRRVSQTGLVELLPDEIEDTEVLLVRGNASRFFGPNKLTLETTLGAASIEPRMGPSIRRDRTFWSATARYQIFEGFGPEGRQTALAVDPFSRRFSDGRGLELFSGIFVDRETIGAPTVKRLDVFAGGGLRGFTIESLDDLFESFDLTLQITILSGAVVADPQRESEYVRFGGVLVARLIDEELRPAIPDRPRAFEPAFVQFVIPAHIDVETDGALDEFQNASIAFELQSKCNSLAMRGSTILFVAGYEIEGYHEGKTLQGLRLFASVGF